MFFICRDRCISLLSGTTVYRFYQGPLYIAFIRDRCISLLSGTAVYRFYQGPLYIAFIRDRCISLLSGTAVYRFDQGPLYIAFIRDRCISLLSGTAVYRFYQGPLYIALIRDRCISLLSGTAVYRFYQGPLYIALIRDRCISLLSGLSDSFSTMHFLNWWIILSAIFTFCVYIIYIYIRLFCSTRYRYIAVMHRNGSFCQYYGFTNWHVKKNHSHRKNMQHYVKWTLSKMKNIFYLSVISMTKNGKYYLNFVGNQIQILQMNLKPIN